MLLIFSALLACVVVSEKLSLFQAQLTGFYSKLKQAITGTIAKCNEVRCFKLFVLRVDDRDNRKVKLRDRSHISILHTAMLLRKNKASFE